MTGCTKTRLRKEVFGRRRSVKESAQYDAKIDKKRQKRSFFTLKSQKYGQKEEYAVYYRVGNIESDEIIYLIWNSINI